MGGGAEGERGEAVCWLDDWIWLSGMDYMTGIEVKHS